MSGAHSDRRYRPPGTIVIGSTVKSRGTEKDKKIPSTSSANSRASLQKNNQKFMIGNALAVRPPKEKEEKVKVQLARSDSKSQESNYKKELEEAKVSIPYK
jgi:hypothetical protein